jgi:nicotinamidase-related amidase
MQNVHGVSVPETVAEMCSPSSTAVLVYDVQVGIMSHVADRDGVTGRIRSVIGAARQSGVPVVYVRHVSVPPTHMGVAAFRVAMAWQRTQKAADVRSAFPPDAPQTQLVAELAPVGDEPVFD